MIQALNNLVKKNDSFRIRIKLENGMPVQSFSEYEPFDIDVVHIKDKEELKDVENEVAKYKFSVLNSCLFYFKIAIFENGYGAVVLTVNHIIADSWSLGLVIKNILKEYHALTNNEKLNDDTNSYKNYINSEKEYKNNKKYEIDRDYWKEVFKTIPGQAAIPSDRKIQKNVSCEARRESFSFTADFVQNIKNFCAQNGVSIFNFLMSIYSIYLSRVSNQDDFVIGTPILNRSNFKEKQTMGMFVNTIPVRINMPENGTFIELAKYIATNIRGVLKHQKYSYMQILEDMRSKNPSISNLYNVLISYQITKAFSNEYGDYETDWIFNGCAENNFNIHIADINDTGELVVSYDYQIDKYSIQDAQELHTRIKYMIEQVLSNKDVKIMNIETVTEEEKNKLIYGFNKTISNYPKDKTIINLFEEQVEKTPDSVAIIFEEQKLTYRELNEKVNKFARHLISLKIKKADVVSILLNKNIDIIISILAILKIGACYVPISPEYPKERIERIIKDSNSKLLITTEGHGASFANNIYIDEFKNIEEYSSLNLHINIEPTDLAYIIYTSGSTGKPKGVAITHMSLLNYIYWANKFYCSNKKTNFPLYSSIAFDLTVTSIFTPLICGGAITVYKEKEIFQTLKDIFLDDFTDIVKLTPAHLSLITEFDFSNTRVKKLIVGGDVLSTELCKKVTEKFKDIIIYNEYGPTETTVGCMIYEYSEATDSYSCVLIGKPIDNTQIYILDNNLKPIPFGAEGEIYISGDGLAKCYINNEEKTKENFIPNPYVKNTLMYKTGDIGVLYRDGNMNCLGRSDNQVKIRGLRIELGEIEDRMNEIPEIKSCIVIKKSDSKSHEYLCAYFTADREIDISTVKKYLGKFLPRYMIPGYFMQIESLPYTTNGKIDRKNLPDPKYNEDKKEISLPRNETDSKLIELVKALLVAEIISIDDNFFFFF